MKTTKTHLSSDAVQTYGNENPGYYVMVVGGGAPTYLHSNRFAAEQEAKRLVNLIPGSVVHVMKVRSTFHNMLEPTARDAQSSIHPKTEERAKRRAVQREKQLSRLAELKQGDRVRISGSHHLHGGKMGFIHHLGDASDPTAYVCLYDEALPPVIGIDANGTMRSVIGIYQEPTRFSATSLTVDKTNPFAPKSATANPPETNDEAPGLATLLGACLGGLVKAALLRTQKTETPEPEHSEYDMTAFAAAQAIENETAVIVIEGEHPYLPMGMAYRGVKSRNDDDVAFIYVKMMDEHGATHEVKVNGSRVRRADDPNVTMVG